MFVYMHAGRLHAAKRFTQLALCPLPDNRPDNLLTNFVTWRGMLTKLMCSPYDKSDPWKLAATLFNGTIYLSEIETEESKTKNAAQTPREEKTSYWGLKFEDYMTKKGKCQNALHMHTQHPS